MANANPQQAVNIQYRKNERGIDEYYITGQHVSLEKLKVEMPRRQPNSKMIKYLQKEIPPYPSPVEFRVSNVAHVTEESGFEGILESEQFMSTAGEFSWWGLKITKEEIKAAENRYMAEQADQAGELNEQEPFLDEFTTSPPFIPNKSRYGNYRFTFPLTDLMQWYKEQNCGGEEPILRVYETVTYRQEIMYTVLIHSPGDYEHFSEYPLLETSKLIHYQDGKIIWKAQAICETHWYEFDSGRAQMLGTHEYYVWDHISLVFHLPKNTFTKIHRRQLIEALEACEIDRIDLSRYEGPKTKEERFSEAETKVSELRSELED